MSGMDSLRGMVVGVAVVTAAVSVFAVARAVSTDDAATAGSSAPPVETPSGSVTEITIADFAFDPGTIEVAAGTSVRWTNEDRAAHSVRSGTDAFAEQTMDQGGTAVATFAEPGTYDYFCGIHPSMSATVVVK
jgi:plastocyanin